MTRPKKDPVGVDLRRMTPQEMSKMPSGTQFKAPEPVDAFETWWAGTGVKTQWVKQVARAAWTEALRQMGCFENEEKNEESTGVRRKE